MTLPYAEGHFGRPFVGIEALDELDPHLGGDIENLTLVEVFRDPDHGVGNQGALGIGRSQGDVSLEGVVEALRLLIGLSQFVLGVGGQRVLGEIPHDRLVGFDGLVPFLELLGELTKQVIHAGSVLGVGVILDQLLEGEACLFEVFGSFFFATELKMTLEELEVALGNVELRTYGQFLVGKDFAEGRDQAVRSD